MALVTEQLAGCVERVSVPVDGSRGFLLLEVNTAAERQLLKLVKANFLYSQPMPQSIPSGAQAVQQFDLETV